MKFTIVTSCLFVATATFAVVSAEGTSLRGKSSALDDGLMGSVERAARVNKLRRHLEDVEEDANGENQAEEDENVDEDEQDENAEEADADAEAEGNEEAQEAEEEGEGEDEEEEEENVDEDEQEQAEKEGDDYVFYDDLAVGNKKWTDKYKSMSRTSQIWTIVLAVWFVVLVLTTFCLCCCGKSTPKEVSSSSTKRSLRQSLMGQNRKEGTDDEQKRGRSKFRLLGRTSSKGKRSSSNGSFE